MSAVAIRNVVLAALFGVLAFLAYGWAYDNGSTAKDIEWQGKYNIDLHAANISLQDALLQLNAEQETSRAYSQAVQESFAFISADYQEKLRHVETRKDSVIAGLRANAQQLRIGIKTASSAGACAPGQDQPGETNTATFGRDGEARAELSDTAAEFLVSLASEADQVVEQLTSCQQLLIAQRRAS
ncbi:lysis protein [Methylobacillus caricis]|uniref:lysis system i-spanin subunit Rz n=1 Tax=Methylobacillus caricis TaxID=1971611 RepID=UPI001CFF9DD1|nr:lysis system i-spanin subunit Rz [Methylobacillus caricis]MCB5187382.1 lysis protein [Methylobacillus caricis]